VFNASDFVRVKRSASLPNAGEADNSYQQRMLSAGSSVQDLSVMRDILSQEGRSERTHGRYLLRFTNPSATGKRFRFMDQLPFFVTPMWHTFQATLDPGGGKASEDLRGLSAMRHLSVQFVSPTRPHDPTQLFLTADVPPGGVVSVFLDVLKNFVQLREFSFACEKGFDVSAAAWMEVDLPKQGNSSAVGDFMKSLAPVVPWQIPPGDSRWRLRFTQGLIILVPMPDFSMPFNVIALSSTAMTFFFGSIFRLTAAGRIPHWVLKKEVVEGGKIARTIRLSLLFGFMGGLWQLAQCAPKDIQSWSVHFESLGLPQDVVEQIIELLLSTRATATKIGL
jgi:phosphatidylinositol glycan class T